QIETLGRTRDDAAGEVFDKIARALGLGFPGGPEIEKLARQGEAEAFSFPRALMREEGKLDFSFSGVKTSVLNQIRREKEKGEQVKTADIAAAFQDAVVDALVEKSFLAVRQIETARQFLLAGGVAANGELRRRLRQRLEGAQMELILPPVELCTDNAAMVAAAGYHYLRQGRKASWDLNAVPNLELGRV
ncbi:MAG: tRNA (adenosine(37)-N6)-threonylcarbamoyltransferase complex transferase subunit TsaD, partial [Firmicutes bacterium]|nr:tRNA (adenosine(37)-N6)-threonylcarbamoyltransferase complex transferase subunit TsaD [Bacillota bacterium]